MCRVRALYDTLEVAGAYIVCLYVEIAVGSGCGIFTWSLGWGFQSRMNTYTVCVCYLVQEAHHSTALESRLWFLQRTNLAHLHIVVPP